MNVCVSTPSCALNGYSPHDLTWRRRFEEAPAGANPTTLEVKRKVKETENNEVDKRWKETHTNAAQRGKRKKTQKASKVGGNHNQSQRGWGKKG